MLGRSAPRLSAPRPGHLAGKRIAIKDNICVAGLPITHGGALAPDYVPEIDATVVTQIIEAGGEITGKTTCEWGCISGGSHAGLGSAPFPIRTTAVTLLVAHHLAVPSWSRPANRHGAWHRPGWVEYQVPASYCGVYGLKPTFGPVPYSGITSLEASIDHCGPITRTAGDNAILLDAIAGPDGLDERLGWAAHPLARSPRGRRARAAHRAPQRGFGTANTDPEVDEKVLAAARRLETLGASVEWVSVSWHLKGTAIWAPITHEGGYLTMWAS